ncbi:MAG TPA: sulfatase [Thermoanaerobaculia bacterium]|nr:sulfatase [Thermoanaerobaculia bacterium]
MPRLKTTHHRRLAGATLLAIACVAAVASAACSSSESGAAPAARNLVVICIDTLRADHVSSYGYARQTTPFIDELARAGTLFANAYAHSDWTVPSTASLLTSLYPSEHGAGIEGESRLLGETTPVLQIRKGVRTLATRLHRTGFRTGLFSANPFLYGSFERDFDAAEVERKNAAELTAAALRWLDQTAGDRFFLYVQYMDLHQPVEPPPPFFNLFPVAEGGVRGREHTDWSFGGIQDQRALEDPAFRRYRAHRIALYDGALRFIDEEIRRLYRRLEQAGLAKQTLVVITSDHGEEFWDHALAERASGHDPRGIWGVGHGHSMYEELLRVPLILRGPGVAESRRLTCPVRHVDVMPTVLDLLGLAGGPGLRGRSLVPMLAKSPEADDCTAVPLIAESPAYGPDSKAVIWKGRKLIVRSQGGDFLFDLRDDPGERRNLLGTPPHLAAGLRAILTRELAGVHGPRAEPLTLDEKTKRELRALGYL